LEAVRRLEPQALYLVSRDPHKIEGVQSIQPNRVTKIFKQLAGTVLVLPAEAPCVQTRTLKRLLNASKSRSRYLAAADAHDSKGAKFVVAAARDIQSVLPRLSLKNGVGALAEALEASPLQSASAEELLEVRTIADWIHTAQVLRRRKCEKLIQSGVFIDDPSTVHIDPEVKVGRGTHIRGWVVIEGASHVGGHCEIGSFTHIVDTEVGSGTVLLDHCFLRSSRIGRNAQIGPFTHLRPDSVVGTKAKVGNFVELKKTELGHGSKAPHLTYLGDAQIGRGVNVGAGTITCNYDGSLKHLTIVDDGAFIGSDVQLVAPVHVGRGAYVAAGSCITKDVPAESLAVARGRQVVKAGWARKKKRRSSRK
jgi:UDP-N-acetylglucosamine diphosphorylase/glucosamine-1-phosphate N-acetyltransferase